MFIDVVINCNCVDLDLRQAVNNLPSSLTAADVQGWGDDEFVSLTSSALSYLSCVVWPASDHIYILNPTLPGLMLGTLAFSLLTTEEETSADMLPPGGLKCRI